MPVGTKYDEAVNEDTDNVKNVSYVVEIDGEKYWVKPMNALHNDVNDDPVFTGEDNPLPTKIKEIVDSLPSGDNNIGKFDIENVTKTGSHGNAWNNQSTGSDGASDSIDLENVSIVDIFGEVDGQTEIEIQKSQNDSDFYDTGIIAEVSEAGDFAFNDLSVAANYIRLISSEDVTATATIAAKM